MGWVARVAKKRVPSETRHAMQVPCGFKIVSPILPFSTHPTPNKTRNLVNTAWIRQEWDAADREGTF